MCWEGFFSPFFSFFPFFFFCLLLDLLLEDEDEDEDDDDDDVLDLLDFFFFFLSPELWSLESGDLVLDFFMFLLLLSSFSIMSVLESSEDDLEKKMFSLFTPLGILTCCCFRRE